MLKKYSNVFNIKHGDLINTKNEIIIKDEEKYKVSKFVDGLFTLIILYVRI